MERYSVGWTDPSGLWSTFNTHVHKVYEIFKLSTAEVGAVGNAVSELIDDACDEWIKNWPKAK